MHSCVEMRLHLRQCLLQLAPAWEQLAEQFAANDSVRVADVDCTKAKSVCKRQNIGGYPTLKAFWDGALQC